MDRDKAKKRYRSGAALALFVALWFALPVAAQEPTDTPTPTATATATPMPTPTIAPTPTREITQREMYIPPNEGIHLNSPGVRMSAELPMALPDLPQSASFPVVVFPRIDPSQWPSISDGRNAVKSEFMARLNDMRLFLNAGYADVNTALNTVRNSTASIRNFIGNPMNVTAQASGGRVTTVTGAAYEMAQSTAVALGYVRAVAAIGPIGVNLVFVFIGLVWILFVNLGEWLLTFMIFIFKSLAGFLRWIFNLIWNVVEFIVNLLGAFL